MKRLSSLLVLFLSITLAFSSNVIATNLTSSSIEKSNGGYHYSTLDHLDKITSNKKSTALVDSDSVKNPADQQINEPMELLSTAIALAVILGGIYYFYKKKSKKGKRKR
jgi:hypothetical protein